jgi:hypothetical protein
VNEESSVDLGSCCSCGTLEGVRNVMCLPKLAPEPGKGWGCAVCGRPNDGAVAVLCDGCLDGTHELLFACKGYPADGERVPIGELAGHFDHDLFKHAEAEGWVCSGCGCTNERACPGGCSWVGHELCSSCAPPEMAG